MENSTMDPTQMSDSCDEVGQLSAVSSGKIYESRKFERCYHAVAIERDKTATNRASSHLLLRLWDWWCNGGVMRLFRSTAVLWPHRIAHHHIRRRVHRRSATQRSTPTCMNAMKITHKLYSKIQKKKCKMKERKRCLKEDLPHFFTSHNELHK